jgi:hypothetical protein
MSSDWWGFDFDISAAAVLVVVVVVVGVVWCCCCCKSDIASGWSRLDRRMWSKFRVVDWLIGFGLALLVCAGI